MSKWVIFVNQKLYKIVPKYSETRKYSGKTTYQMDPKLSGLQLMSWTHIAGPTHLLLYDTKYYIGIIKWKSSTDSQNWANLLFLCNISSSKTRWVVPFSKVCTTTRHTIFKRTSSFHQIYFPLVGCFKG